MNNSKRLVCFLSSFLWLVSIVLMQSPMYAQQQNYTLNRDYLWGYDNYFNDKEQTQQTFVKPYRNVDLNKVKDSSAAFPVSYVSWKRKKENTKKKKFDLHVSPLITSQVGYQAGSTSRATHDFAIGGNIVGDIGKKFSFNVKVLAGEANYTSYMDAIISQTHVIPGIGYAYRANNNLLNPTYSYQYYTGYVSYSPNKIFNLQLGRDKQFWGDGYRSLFLSDVSAPYPYFKITTNIWKFTYVNLYTVMTDAGDSSGLKKNWLPKYGSFHYLGTNLTKRINIGLFESIIWQGTSGGRYRGYDVDYLNPVIFYNPVEYSLGPADNAFVGLSCKIKLFKKQQLYGQVMLDDFSLKDLIKRDGYFANKYGCQGGFKSFDVFKVPGLNFQTELNVVRPYTYADASVQQNYSNLNQPLASPLGANFVELATFLNYRYKRVFTEAKCTYAVYGADKPGTDYGQNIFLSYYAYTVPVYGNYITQGVQTKLMNLSLRAAYIVDPKINLRVELGAQYRLEESVLGTQRIPYVYFAIRTDLGNLYNDF